MATNNNQIQIGAGVVSVGAYVAAGAGGSLTDVGHTIAPIELSFAFEDISLISERAQGPIAYKAVGQTITLKIPMLEVNPEHWRQVLRQPAANLTGGTLLIGDGATQYHQITCVVPSTEVVPTSYTTQTWTFWKCQFGQLEAPQFAKGAWVVLNATVNILRDDTVTTLDKYCRMVYA